jgi:valyl-tRNA synthetase
MDSEVYQRTVTYFEELMQLLHPFVPFITEEIYHLLNEQSDDLCIKQYQPIKASNESITVAGELLKNVISALRDARNKNQLKPKETIKLHIQTENVSSYQAIEKILAKQVNAEQTSFTKEPIANSIVVAIEKDKFFIETEKVLDATTLKAELLKDLEYQTKFLHSVTIKLSNERFVQNAKPEVVDLERKKQSDAAARIKTIEESLGNLK